MSLDRPWRRCGLKKRGRGTWETDHLPILGWSVTRRPATAAIRRDDREEAMRLSGTATLGGEAYRRWSESSLDQVRANLIKAEFLGSGFAPLDADQVGSV